MFTGPRSHIQHSVGKCKGKNFENHIKKIINMMPDFRKQALVINLSNFHKIFMIPIKDTNFKTQSKIILTSYSVTYDKE